MSDSDPVFDALFNDDAESARALLDDGAPLSFETAAALGDLDYLRTVDEDHGQRWSAFLLSCKTGQLEVVRYLVPRGIDLSIYPPGHEWGGVGASGLHWAASHGHTELTRFLVESGTPVDIVDDTFDNTPLGWALMDNQLEVVEVLLRLGADPDKAR